MNEREPTSDEIAGMRWWNSLSDRERAEWLRRANSARPVDAWAAYKASSSQGENR